MKTSDIFRPFEDWSGGNETYFGLCIKDGKIFETIEDDENFQEWYIQKCGDSWLIECGYAENAAFEVYRGDIPTREFFEALIYNVEGGFNITQL